MHMWYMCSTLFQVLQNLVQYNKQAKQGAEHVLFAASGACCIAVNYNTCIPLYVVAMQ